MSEMDDNDIIIKTGDLLKHLMGGASQGTIDYETAVSVYHLPEGFEKHLEAAADLVGLEIALKGAKSASLRKKKPVIGIA